MHGLVRVVALGAVIFLTVVAVSGCWNYREIDETSFPVALGLDRGKGNQITLSVQLPLPAVAGGGQGGGGNGGQQAGMKNSEVVSVEAPTISDGLDLINSFVEKPVVLKHVKAIIFSEELAREGMNNWLEYFVRNLQLRRVTTLVITNGVSAKSLLEKSQPILLQNPAKIWELYIAVQGKTAIIPVSTLLSFYNAMRSPGESPVAMLAGITTGPGGGKGDQKDSGDKETGFLAGQIPREGGGKLEVMGSAVFKGDKLVGKLTGSETKLAHILRGEFKETAYSIRDPGAEDHRVSLRLIQERKPEVKVNMREGRAEISAKVFLNLEIMAVESGISYENPRLTPVLEQAIARELEEKLQQLVYRTQVDFGTDIFHFAQHARHLVATWGEWERLNWAELYPVADVYIDVRARVRQTWLLRKVMPVKQ